MKRDLVFGNLHIGKDVPDEVKTIKASIEAPREKYLDAVEGALSAGMPRGTYDHWVLFESEGGTE